MAWREWMKPFASDNPLYNEALRFGREIIREQDEQIAVPGSCPV
jgi:hypothetical protein